MRLPTGTFVTACALSAALLAAGCGADGDEGAKASGELFLQPVEDQGPDPFTDSTATSSATPTPVTRTPHSAPTAHSGPGVTAPASLTGVRTYSGWTPGLYGGRARTGSCDVDRQIRLLTADPGRAQAFARASGVSRAAIPGYLRGLTSAELRADTRVTNHGYRDGRATGHQAVLQAGTAVLVDDRGVPRVRCACGNPLGAPVAMRGTPGSSGRAWPGYRPADVIVVTPAPQAITNITLINVVNNTWIERPIGHDVRRDKVVPRPQSQSQSQSQSQTDRPSASHPQSQSQSPSQTDRPSPSHQQSQVTESGGLPSDGASSAEGGEEAAPALEEPATEAATPVVEDDAPLPTPEAGSTTPSLPGEPTLREPVEPLDLSDETGPGTGPETVPETLDLPDGGGLIPDDPDDVDHPDVSDDMGDMGDLGETGDLVETGESADGNAPDVPDVPDAPETADKGIQPQNLS